MYPHLYALVVTTSGGAGYYQELATLTSYNDNSIRFIAPRQTSGRRVCMSYTLRQPLHAWVLKSNFLEVMKEWDYKPLQAT